MGAQATPDQQHHVYRALQGKLAGRPSLRVLETMELGLE